MTQLTILTFPDSRLRKIAAPVAEIDASVTRLVDDMLETMYAANGIGLAATQINVQKRIVVMDLSEEKNAPQVFINPVITPVGNEHSVHQEGCLSVPEFYDDVERFETVSLQALNRSGEPFEKVCEDLLSICIQHEIDHLDGKLFVDYLSPFKRNRIKKKLQQLSKNPD